MGNLFETFSELKVNSNLQQKKMSQQYYKKIKLLGKGTFATVYLVQSTRHKLCALKKISLSSLSDSQLQDVRLESDILQKLNHPNIIKFIQTYRTKSNKLIIIMEYAPNGTLSDYLNLNNEKMIDQDQILDWICQICLTLKYIHSKNIVHRDIKLSNIFLSQKNRIKLGDFGLSQILDKNRIQKSGFAGTAYYLAPEVILNQRYNEKCDIWSLGVTIYFLCTGKLPFDAASISKVFELIVEGNFNPIFGYSDQLKQIISQMLQSNPNNRPTAAQILNNKFLRSRISKFLYQQHNKLFVNRQYQMFIECLKKVEKQNMLRIYQKNKNSLQIFSKKTYLANQNIKRQTD